MKKFMSLVLALVMVMAMMVPAMAAMGGTLTGGSIKINDAVSGQTYNAYQLLYLESYNADTHAYAYKANSAWETWLKTQTTYLAFDEQGYVTWVEGADAEAFAKLAQAQAKNMTADATQTTAATDPASTVTVTFNDLKLGYYLVDTTLGTLCSLDTTQPDVEMYEKNEAPTAEKKVQEDSDKSWGDDNDADFNQTVNFEVTIEAKKGAQNYILHDKMSAGLTFDANSVAIEGLTAGTHYNVVTENLGDDCTFHIVFVQSYLDSLTANTTLKVTYSATLNENAVVGTAGNENEIKLQYGDENHPSYTPEDETITYTWDMDVLKYANNVKTDVLADAKFVLLNSAKNKVATVVDGKLTGWVDVPATNEDGTITWPANTELTTDANGKIAIDGLDADTYYLRETQAPAGYNKLASDVEVKVVGATETTDEEGKTTLTYSTVVAEVNNESGTELPSTGGMGTTMMYIGGGLLVAFAVIMLATKRRMNAAE